jgi:LemA protein
MPLTVLILLLAGLLLWTAITFNRLVRRRNLLAEAFGGIDVQLKRRYDLVGNLVVAVKGYAGHEKDVLERVAALRGLGAGARTPQRADQENALADSLQRLLAVVEAYPDLKASANFLALQAQLAQLEDQLQMARRYYNGTVRDYNILVESFPSSWVARLFAFGREEFFEIVTVSQREAPKVEL